MPEQNQDLLGAPAAPTAEQLEHAPLADFLALQRDVLELEDYLLRRLFFAAPDIATVTLGAAPGAGGEVTLRGDQQDPFAGVFVANATAIAVAVGFEAGSAPLGVRVPAGAWLTLPMRYANLSVGTTTAADAQGPAAAIIVARLRVPPSPAAGRYGP